MDVKPKKSLGQHFLIDLNAAVKIANIIDLYDGENVLEIGPGKGVMTKLLLEKSRFNLKVVEIDRESVTYLEHYFKELEDRIISNDFLRLDIKHYFGEEKFAIIGNFPYNISSQILFRVFENHELVPFFGGMFQKEVAARVCSKGGNKDYGILSVLLQAYYDIEYLFTVDEGAFFPPPRVKSGVMQMKLKTEIADFDKGKLKNLVKTAFNHRRKMLSNTISHIMPPDWPMEYRTKRPEQLNVEQFIELAKIHI